MSAVDIKLLNIALKKMSEGIGMFWQYKEGKCCMATCYYSVFFKQLL